MLERVAALAEKKFVIVIRISQCGVDFLIRQSQVSKEDVYDFLTRLDEQSDRFFRRLADEGRVMVPSETLRRD